MAYQCLHCSRTFSTPFGLKRHISDRHQYIDEGEPSQSNLLPYEEPGLWDDDLPTKEPGLWDLLIEEPIWDDLPTEVRP